MAWEGSKDLHIEAARKAWVTRKKTYGRSGAKTHDDLHSTIQKAQYLKKELGMVVRSLKKLEKTFNKDRVV